MSKIYIVIKGKKPGIYNNWEECKLQVNGFKNSIYKSFKSIEDIYKDEKFKKIYIDFNKNINTTIINENIENKKTDIDCKTISVDGACSGNPGKGEYRIVETCTKKELFKSMVFDNATNNIMEFFALVDGLNILKNKLTEFKIYTDSITAIAWVKNRNVNTNVKDDFLINLIKEKILILNSIEDDFIKEKILKWDTKKLGEIPADFGRK